LGLADHGTRLIARFSEVPAGVHLFVETAPAITRTSNGTTSGGLQLVQADASCAGLFDATLAAGTGTACWEVLTSDRLVTEQAAIRVVAAYESDEAGGLPALGTARAAGQVAPLSSFAIGGDASVPVPRFVIGLVEQDLFVIASTGSEVPTASHAALAALAALLAVASWLLLRRPR
jgi:hypothetical protein